jgi:hypothetical protein
VHCGGGDAADGVGVCPLGALLGSDEPGAPDAGDPEPVGVGEPEPVDAEDASTVTAEASEDVEPVKFSSPAYSAVTSCEPTAL